MDRQLEPKNAIDDGGASFMGAQTFIPYLYEAHWRGGFQVPGNEKEMDGIRWLNEGPLDVMVLRLYASSSHFSLGELDMHLCVP